MEAKTMLRASGSWAVDVEWLNRRMFGGVKTEKKTLLSAERQVGLPAEKRHIMVAAEALQNSQQYDGSPFDRHKQC
jgi:hypothetical protein